MKIKEKLEPIAVIEIPEKIRGMISRKALSAWNSLADFEPGGKYAQPGQVWRGPKERFLAEKIEELEKQYGSDPLVRKAYAEFLPPVQGPHLTDEEQEAENF